RTLIRPGRSGAASVSTERDGCGARRVSRQTGIMTEPQRPLGTLGVWRRRDGLTPEFAAGVERLGYTTLWIGGSPAADLAEAEACLDATENLVVATGIVNIWRADAHEAAASFHRLETRHPGRFVLGIGSGHSEAD